MSTETTLIVFALLSTLSSGLICAASVCRFLQTEDAPLGLVVSVGVGSLIVAGISSLTSLGHPELFLGALTHVGTGIFWQLLGSLICVGFSVLFLILYFRDIEGPSVNVCIGLAAIGSLVVMGGIGKSFVMPWRPAWDSYSIVFIFLGLALACSVNFYNFLSTATEGVIKLPQFLKIIMAIFAPITLIFYLIALGLSDNSVAVQAQSELLTGKLAAVFWCFVIVGMVLPSLIAVLRKRKAFIYLVGSICSILASGVFQFLLLAIDEPSFRIFVH